MKIRNLRIHDRQRFAHGVEINFYDPLQKKIRDRTVIVGKNGSGKTTLLEALYTMIDLIGRSGQQTEVENDSIFDRAVDVRIIVPGIHSYLLISTEERNEGKAKEDIYLSGVRAKDYFDKVQFGGAFHRSEQGKNLINAIRTSIAGVDEEPDIGNLVYFPTDRITYFVDSRYRGDLVNERPLYKWAYKYDRNHNKWEGSLESYLCWLYFRDLKVKEQDPQAQSRFAEFKGIVNRFLEEKEITTVTFSYRVEVKDTETGNTFGLSALSSGERQIILLIGELFRNIQKGSVVLIDEPEIHLHPVWQKLLISTLTAICKKYEAQLIVTTQSPRIAESFLEHEVIELDDLLEESKS